MPLILILIGIGFEQVIKWRYFNFLFIGIALICAYNFSELRYLYRPLKILQITESMDFLVKNNIKGEQLYIHPIAFPAYDYYTNINPRMTQWSTLRNGKQLDYATNYDSLGQTIKGKAAILYGHVENPERDAQQAALNKHLTTIEHYSTVLSQVYIYNAPTN